MKGTPAAIGVICAIIACPATAFALDNCPRLPDPPKKAASQPDKPRPPPEFLVRTGGDSDQGGRLVFLGDSLTAGSTASSPEFRLAPQVSDLYGGRRYESYANGGLTSTQIRNLASRESFPPDAVVIIWAGRNNAGKPDVVAADVQAIVDQIAPRRYLVLSVLHPLFDAGYTPGDPEYEGYARVNRKLAETFPHNFVVVGADFECGDRADNTHPDDSGYTKVAAAVHAALQERGW
ncbi:MAG: SGNH/GDSL hydrolase family protein [Rhizobiales bacterium]|nr:SGNH/GDSL hydrolase family protein [Hyphomicrobiales bacterium]